MTTTVPRTPPRPWVKLLWAGIVLQSLTYCSGSTTTGGGSAGAAGSGQAGRGGDGAAGFGYAGHTADCLTNCHGGCADWMCGKGTGGNGGAPSSGTGGMLSGNGGNAAAGVGGFGFAGHTADCLSNCHPGCGLCGGQTFGGTPAAGANGLGGALDGLGGAAEGGQGAGGEPAAMRRSPPSESRACYALTGYEADPCLPADDSLLEWLSQPNLGCPLTVVGGPTLTSGPIGRACCYSVSCAQGSE